MRAYKKALAFLLMLCIAVCSFSVAFAQEVADLVVYGTIYTSNAGQEVAQALAVKDGRYIYVGDKAGVKPYIGSGTEVIRHKAGMVMAGATEAHGHYMMQSMEKLLVPTEAASFAELKADLTAFMAKYPDKAVYEGAGWDRKNDLAPNADINYMAELDKLCPDKPVLLVDNDHHQAVCNTKAFKLCFEDKGVSLQDAAKGREDTASLPGAVFLRLPDGQANGYLRDQAVFVALRKIASDLFSTEEYEAVVQDMQQDMYRQGFTNYNDGLSNSMGYGIIEALFKADKEGKLKVNMCPNMNILVIEMLDDEGMNAFVAGVEKYAQKASGHILPAGIKIFADGVTETQTGVLDVPYIGTENYGNVVLDEEGIYRLAKAANAKGIGIHSHSYGNVAVNYTVNAFIRAQQEVNNGTRNTLTHVMNVLPQDFKRMADNHIAVAENINWHTPITEAYLRVMDFPGGVPASLWITSYPINSLVSNGVITASSTDAPADNGFPTDVFGIVELAVNPRAVHWVEGLPPLDQEEAMRADITKEKMATATILNADEYVSVKTALDIMTINGARFMQIDRERGSIEVGKYADFVLVDKNVLACPLDEIHEAKAEKVYFEGQQVY